MANATEHRCRVLAIETSGRTASIALLDAVDHGEANTLDLRSLDETGRRHARTLIPELKQLLQDHNLHPSDCDCIAVATGPGSFTGLRVGVTAAKTLAWALQKPIVGISTMEIIATQALRNESSVSVMVNAEREQLFVAEATKSEDGIDLATMRIVDAGFWLQGLAEGSVVVGPVPQRVLDQVPSHVRLLSDEIGTPSAGTVAELAAASYFVDRTDDVFALLPTYGRLSAAEEKRLQDNSSR